MRNVLIVLSFVSRACVKITRRDQSELRKDASRGSNLYLTVKYSNLQDMNIEQVHYEYIFGAYLNIDIFK